MTDAGPRLSRHGPTGRAEFRRIVLDSLIASAASELELRQSRRQRMRARSAERRLAELLYERRVLDGDRYIARPWKWVRAASTGYVVTVAWLVGAVLLGAQIARHGIHSRLTIAGDIGMLALSLLWFLLAVARIPFTVSEGDRPEAAPHE